MPSHVRLLALCGAIAAGFTLFISGCSQSATKSEPVADNTRAAESSAQEPGAVSDSAVKVARAEGPIQAKRDDAAPSPDGAPAEIPADQPAAPIAEAESPLPLDNVATADLTMPKVLLTEEHAAMCRVMVGDAFPEMKLPDPAGKPHALDELKGEKLTLVVFWDARQPSAREQLADMARYHQRRFGDKGLSIVAIDTGDPPQLAGELAQQAGAKFPVLCDADGAAFQQVATAKIPRSYLLDTTGKVLWLDLEWSATTRRDMVQAIRYALAH